MFVIMETFQKGFAWNVEFFRGVRSLPFCFFAQLRCLQFLLGIIIISLVLKLVMWRKNQSSGR